jgi:anti-sigma-K factor RskA
MNYGNPKLQSLLAAEYVLGTLHGTARDRFETLLIREPGIRDAVEYWQTRLNPLAETVAPAFPSRHVWKKIRTRIRARDSVRSRVLNAVWGNLDFWRGFSLASVILIVGYLVAAPDAPVTRTTTSYIAVLQDDRARPMMVASMGHDGRTLKVDMLGDDNTTAEEVMQVWCVPKDGGKPMSLGLLTTKQGVFELSIDQLKGLHKAAEIAISIEPMEVAPAEAPTGQIMYRGVMI